MLLPDVAVAAHAALGAKCSPPRRFCPSVETFAEQGHRQAEKEQGTGRSSMRRRGAFGPCEKSKAPRRSPRSARARALARARACAQQRRESLTGGATSLLLEPPFPAAFPGWTCSSAQAHRSSAIRGERDPCASADADADAETLRRIYRRHDGALARRGMVGLSFRCTGQARAGPGRPGRPWRPSLDLGPGRLLLSLGRTFPPTSFGSGP